jgi:hypothetical protein
MLYLLEGTLGSPLGGSDYRPAGIYYANSLAARASGALGRVWDRHVEKKARLITNVSSQVPFPVDILREENVARLQTPHRAIGGFYLHATLQHYDVLALRSVVPRRLVASRDPPQVSVPFSPQKAGYLTDIALLEAWGHVLHVRFPILSAVQSQEAHCSLAFLAARLTSCVWEG